MKRDTLLKPEMRAQAVRAVMHITRREVTARGGTPWDGVTVLLSAFVGAYAVNSVSARHSRWRARLSMLFQLNRIFAECWKLAQVAAKEADNAEDH